MPQPPVTPVTEGTAGAHPAPTVQVPARGEWRPPIHRSDQRLPGPSTHPFG